MEPTHSRAIQKCRPYRTSDLQTASEIVSSIQASKHSISAELQAAIVAEAVKMKNQHRERCRASQALYRQRQQKVAKGIQVEMAELQSEVKKLEVRHHECISKQSVPAIWALAATYFRRLRLLLMSPLTQYASAVNFLRGVLASDVVGTSSLGVEAQIENWRLFALYFGDIDLVLKSMNMPTSDTLVATTSTTVTITGDTLRYAFPHLNNDGNGGDHGGKWSPLAAKLLNQRLVMRGSVFFGWDNSSGRVMRLQTRMDMLSQLLKLLGSLEEVSCVFDKALITPECQFVTRE